MNPTRMSIELRDQNGVLIKVLNKLVKGLTWEYDRIGGCGRATLSLAAPYDFFQDNIGPDYDVRIWLEDETGIAKLWYRGYVESHKPTLQDNDSIDLSLFGYVGQLKRVRVAKTYSGMEVSAIVKDILDTLVIPSTDITYSSSDIVDTGFSVDTLTFDTMADSALKTLADLAGSYEWGVDVNKNFFFKPLSTVIRHYLRIGKEITLYDSLDDYSQIVNRIYLKGKNTNGITFEDQIDNTESQESYGLRSQVVSNSAILTSAVSQKYGSGLLADQARVTRRISITVPKNLKFYESQLPLGSLSIITKTLPASKKYGDSDAIYGTFKYAGTPSFQIDKLAYKLANEGVDLTIQAGSQRPNIYLQIKQLQFEIDQLRSN